MRAESARFADALAAADPAAPVPTCPEWTAADLLWHLTETQVLWAVVVRDRLAEPGPAQAAKPPRPADHRELVALARDTTAMLAAALDDADDAEPVWTWFPGEHTVGFVRRRQAHEALIHRIDAELAAGGPVSPVDRYLATDGVTEVLHLTCDDTPSWASRVPDGPLGEITTTDTDASWLVRLGRLTGTSPRTGDVWDFAALTWATEGTPAFSVSGSAADVDAWLWNRAADTAVTRSGDHAAFDALVRDGLV